MAHLALVIVLGIVLGTGLLSKWRYRAVRRSANREMRAQAERGFEARVAAQLEENERRYGVTGHVRAPTAEEIAEVRKKVGWER